MLLDSSAAPCGVFSSGVAEIRRNPYVAIYGSPQKLCFDVVSNSTRKTGCVNQTSRNIYSCSERWRSKYVRFPYHCVSVQPKPTHFWYNVHFRSPTHDLTPYAQIHFTTAAKGSWANILFLGSRRVRGESWHNNLLVENFNFLDTNKIPTKTLRHSRHYFLLLESKRKESEIKSTINFKLSSILSFTTEGVFTSEQSLFNRLVCAKPHLEESNAFYFPYGLYFHFLAKVTLFMIEENRPLYLQFSKRQQTNIVAMPGSLLSLQFTFERHENFSFSLHWVPYKDEDVLSVLVPNTCGAGVIALTSNTSSYCLNFSSGVTQNSYYLFFRGKLQMQKLCSGRHLVRGMVGVKKDLSWIGASNLCAGTGGSLPIFRSREELRNLLKLIKLSPYLPPLNSLFVGLLQMNDSKIVRNFVSEGVSKQIGWVLSLYKLSFQIWQSLDPVSFLPLPCQQSMTLQFSQTICWEQKERQEMCGQADKNVHFSSKQRNISCVILVVDNLSQSKIVLVDCHKPTLEDFFCFVDNVIEKNVQKQKKTSHLFCHKTHFQINTSCYEIRWQNVPNTNLFKKQNSPNASQIFLHLFDSVNADSFPNFVERQSFGTIQLYRYENVYRQTVQTKDSGEFQAFTVDRKRPNTIEPRGNTFVCQQKTLISLLYMCDGIPDCTNEDDEKQCHFAGNTFCSKCFLKAGTNVCEVHSFYQKGNPSKTIHKILRNTSAICMKHGELACSNENPICYFLSDICLFKLSHSGNLVPCPQGEHLAQCKGFACSSNFKCLGYYCVPWSYVCDGKWNCPKGYDESPGYPCGAKRNCSGMFKCKNSQICIHFADLCDEQKDCSDKDDEQLCTLHQHSCPLSCHCVGLAVYCADVQRLSSPLVDYQPYFSLSIKRCSLSVKSQVTFTFPDIIKAGIVESGLKEACFLFPEGTKLLHVNFSFNLLSKIRANCFSGNDQLLVVILAKNRIEFVQADAFANLGKIQVLDVSGNLLLDMISLQTMGIQNLCFLSLEHNVLANLESNIFDGKKLQILHTNDYHLCCLVSSDTHCSKKIPWFFGCQHLLPSTQIAVSFYVIFAAVVVLNCASLCAQKFSPIQDNSTAFKKIVSCVNTTDLSFSLSLLILLSADLTFKDNYVFKDISWRSDSFCFLNFFLVLNFTFLYPLLLLLLSFARLQVVQNPLDTTFKNATLVLRYLLGIIGSITFLSVLFVLLTRFMSKDGTLPFFLCSPFIDPANALVVIHVLTWLSSVETFGMTVLILTLYLYLIAALTQFQDSFAQSVSHKRPNTLLILQLVVITVSNILCWVPTSVMYLTSQYLDQYPTEMLIWSQIAVTPINSIVNPLVFVATTLKKH